MAKLPTLAFVCILILLISLGFWQLDRADQKGIELALSIQRQSEERLMINDQTSDEKSIPRYTKIEMRGQYDIHHQFLIDNQMFKSKPGYLVMTPFKIHQSDNAVLVNRGWVPLNLDRSRLPKIPLQTVATKIIGRVNNFPSVGIKLAGAEIPTESWPSVVQVVDTKVLAEKLGYVLYPFQVELNQTMSDGFLRDWKTASVMPPEKHVAYAVQWFLLALTLVFLFFWNSVKKS